MAAGTANAADGRGARTAAPMLRSVLVSLPAPLHRYPYAEYVALEEHSAVRHEFVAGEIYAMAGGTPEHAAIAASVLRLLGNLLPAGCRGYTSDLRVRIAASDVTTYPDGAVICGKVLRSVDDALAATNPLILIEVTSPSTQAYDEGAKLGFYRLIPSVREVIVVSHDRHRVVVHRREDDGSWSSHESGPGADILVSCVGARLTVDEIYRDVG
ncbi:MAG: Uma2 family endonuclease [Polyangiaceae bacterium]